MQGEQAYSPPYEVVVTTHGGLFPMHPLIDRAKSAGFSPRYIRERVLPSWWDDEIARTPAGFAQAAAIISRHTGLDFDSLCSEQTPCFRPAECRFKRAKNRTGDDLNLAKSMGVQLASFVALGVTAPVRDLPSTGGEVREAILAKGDLVTLESLVEYCWGMGIIVLQFTDLPERSKRMDAMATIVGGRPAIVVCHGRTEAHLLFDVAHELGHLALRHISDGQSLVDEKIDRDSNDREEFAANQYALCAILGDAKNFYLRDGYRFPSASVLAEIARNAEKKDRIDAGHFVLNYAHTMARKHVGEPGAFWGTANAALKLLGVQQDGLLTISEATDSHVRWEELPDDAAEFAKRLLIKP